MNYDTLEKLKIKIKQNYQSKIMRNFGKNITVNVWQNINHLMYHKYSLLFRLIANFTVNLF